MQRGAYDMKYFLELSRKKTKSGSIIAQCCLVKLCRAGGATDSTTNNTNRAVKAEFRASIKQPRVKSQSLARNNSTVW